MLKQLACFGVLLTIASSCTIQPGDYRVYRVAVNGVQLGCQYKNPDDFEDDNYFDAAILAIYAADKNTYFLEDGADSFAGSRSGKDYSFVGEYLHQARYDENQGFSRDFQIQETLNTVYQFEISGKEIYGTVTKQYASGCSGSEDDCDSIQIYDRVCTDVLEIFGSEVEDSDIEYALGGPGVGGGVIPGEGG